MSTIWMPGGGGPDLSVVNVTEDDIVAPKVIVDKDGKPLVGKLIDRPSTTGAVSVARGGADNNYIFTRIPVGAYRTPTGVGYPEVTMPQSDVASAGGLTAAKLMAGQNAFGLNGTATSDATATGPDILPGKFAYGNGVKIPGSMSTMNAQTINPTASKQTIQCANKYMNGNVDVNGVSNLTAANVKKGQTVGGTAGACDWVDASEADSNFLGLTELPFTTNYRTFSDAQRDRSMMTLLYDAVFKPQYTYTIFKFTTVSSIRIVLDQGYRDVMNTYKYSVDNGYQLVFVTFYRIGPAAGVDPGRLRIWACAYSPAGISDTPRMSIQFLGGTSFIGA